MTAQTRNRGIEVVVDEAAIRRFVALLHERAAAALEGAREPGVLQLCRLRPADEKMCVSSFLIGDTKNMADVAINDAQRGFNVFAELRTVRPGRPVGRGRINATRGLFAFGIDRDADRNKAGRALNGDASITVQTSPGNVQEILFLDRALTPEEAVPIGAAIRAVTGADSCTGVITQPVRVPGTVNYPNAKKQARGRVPCPTSILATTDKVWTRDELVAAFPSPPPRPPAPAKPRPRKGQMAATRVTAKAKRKTADRSAQFQATVKAAVESGMTMDDLEAELRKHPEGCASKYLEPTDRLRVEIERSWAKAEQQQAENEQPTIAPDPDADGAALLNDVAAFLARFVIYPSPAAHTAHVLWVAHAHLMELWDSTPRLAFLSPERESGKTRALEITQLLVPRPVMAFDVSASYLFRKVADEAGRPTILYDEIDCVFREHSGGNHEDVRALINAGHRKGAVAGRCVVRGRYVDFEEMPAYAAVALAGIDYLPDTILSRSVVIRMRRRMPREAIEPFRARLHEAKGYALRDRLAAWAAGVEDQITERWPEMPESVVDRAADTWEALIAIADAVGGSWPDTARRSAVTMVAALKEAQAESPKTRLLADMRTILADHTALPTAIVLEKLWHLPESLWQEVRGKPLTDMGLARMLRSYGIRSKDIRVGEKIAKHYIKADFQEAWESYLPPL